jgi:molybdopterin/thiamine biosynthesis adenylyltransferase/proteasome lid subunit RPN8/RPN11
VSTLALPEELFAELAATLALPVESAGFILAGKAEGDGLTLLARSIHWVPDDGYEVRESNRLRIASTAYVPALSAAEEDGAVAIFFHSHPRSAPAPSRYDEQVDRVLHSPAQIRTGQDLYASLILGGSLGAESFSGKIWHSEESAPLTRLRIVGSRLRLLDGSKYEPDSGRFDRQIRAFGQSGQAMLAALHVGIVGAGGTGSAVFEQIARLGVGRITVIDDDELTESNLTRIHESAQADIGHAKVEIARAAAARIGTTTSVEAIESKVTRLNAVRRLRHCDLVFGCTDDNAGRAVLSRLAYWYLIPVIDTAFLVDTVGERVRGLFGRVTTVFPGASCLLCRGRIDLSQLAAEGLPSKERERLAAEGYVPGLGDPDPSVGPYTTLVGALAVSEMLDRLFGFSDEDDPPTELLLRLHDRIISSLRRDPQPGHYCVDRSIWGRGDQDPLLEQLWADSETG